MSEKESDTENVKQSRRIKDLTPAEFAALLNRIVPPFFASGAVAFPAGRSVSARLKGWLPDFTKLTPSVLPKLHLPTADDLLPKTVALASEGWFYDPEIAYSDFQNANEALVHGNVMEADEIMREHFSLRAHEIEHRLVERYPSRASILAQAFTAHHGGQHALSVLAFLAQADGICLETRGGHFFLRDKKKRRLKKDSRAPRETASYVERSRREVWDSIALVALEIDLPIFESMSRIGAGVDVFNRHAILHGKSVGYGTLTNSFKAISLLNYVAFGAETAKQSNE